MSNEKKKTMETDQIKLLKILAEEIREKMKTQTKEDAIATLHAAGILTKKGNFTKHYKNLGRACTRIETREKK